MQKTTFPYEIIIADDCSTDGTSAICAEYAAKYPNKIRHLRGEYNVGGVEKERRAIEAAQGEYIALCEGDDYWIDPKKLQKQVDFLETHPDYSVTWTRYEKCLQIEDKYLSDGNEDLFKDGQESVEITTHMFLHRWITQYLTMVFRRSAYDNTWCTRYKYFRDSHQFYHLLQDGRGAILNFVGGVYRQTGDGMYSDLDHIRRQEIQIEVFKELWKVNNDEIAKEMYLFNTRYLLEQMRNAKAPKKEQYKYAWKLFVSSGDLRGWLSNIIKI
jgi:glycosyltransferase involved in cell wall biosynthesis